MCCSSWGRVVRVCGDVANGSRISFSGELVKGSLSIDGLWSLKLPLSARDGVGVFGVGGRAGGGLWEEMRGGNEAPG